MKGGLVRFLFGLALGAMLSLAISLGTFGIVAWVIAVVIVGIMTPRFAMLSGTLLGLGIALFLLTLNHISICSSTDDFCGRSNPWPFLIGSVALIGVGILLGAVTFVRGVRA